MTTLRRRGEFWTEVKRVVDVGGTPVVKETSCCCAAPGSTAKGCSIVAGNKTRCRCFCHIKRVQKSDLRANEVEVTDG